MKTCLVPLVAALTAALPTLSGSAPAQDTRPALPLIRPAAPTPETPPSDPYEALVEEYNQARNAWYQDYAKAREEGGETLEAFLRDRPQAEVTFVPRFEAKATELAGQPAAVRFLVWLAQNDHEDRKAHFEALLANHLDDPSLAGTTGLLIFENDDAWALGLLQRLLDGSPHEEVRLQALLSRAEIHKRSGDPERLELAKADYRTLAECSMPGLVERAKGNLFEIEHLQIGMVAPDIEGEDLHGETFRLSDYRGNVVVLDFWGDW